MPNQKSISKKAAPISGAAKASSDLLTDYAIPFFHYLTIPANTAQSSYVSASVKLPLGEVRRLTVGVPAGVQGLAGLQIWRGAYQIFPMPEGVWFTSDNVVLSFSLFNAVTTHPFEIVMRGYNNDETYNHTLWIGIEMFGARKDLPPALLQFFDYLSNK